jgi:hypothetical protein
MHTKLAQVDTVEYYYGCSHIGTPPTGARHPRFAALVCEGLVGMEKA